MERICPICKRDKLEEKKKNGYKLCYCHECEFYFCANIPPEHDVYYNEKSNLTKPGKGEWNSLRWGQRRFLKSHTDGENLLDIGCGNGNFLSACEKRNIPAQGYDISARMIEFNRAAGHKVYDNTDEITDSSYDIVTMWEVLEHTDSPDLLIKEVWRVLKEEGKLYISTPNFRHPAVNRTNLKKYWPPFHLTFWTKKSISYFLKRNGFRIKKIMYRPFNAYLIKNLSCMECIKAIIHEMSLIGMEFVIVAVKEGNER